MKKIILINDDDVEIFNVDGNTVDSYGDMNNLVKKLNEKMKVSKVNLAKKTNGTMLSGDKWVMEWFDKDGANTIDQDAIMKALKVDNLDDYKKRGKPTKMLKVKPLVN